MRLSVYPNDPGYQPRLILTAEIYFNGEKQNRCVTADEELGMIERYKEDENGKMLHEKGIMLTETLYGKVEIGIPDDNDKQSS